ncbi:MAG: hypothetical protein ACW97P_07045 [Candidatus Hodarchaeales archaeon]
MALGMILAKKRFSKYRNTNTLRQRPPRCSKYRNTNTLRRRLIASSMPTLPCFTEKKNAFFCKKDLATREKVCYNKRMSKAQIERAIQVKIQAFRSHKIKWMNAERQGNLMESIKWENAMAQDLDAIERFKSMKPLEVN